MSGESADCPNCETDDAVRDMRSGHRLTCDGCGLVFNSRGAATVVEGPRPGFGGSKGGGNGRKTTLHDYEDGTHE